jgi:hypothetical protein
MQPAALDKVTGERVASRANPLTDLANIGACRLPVVGFKVLPHVAHVRGYFAAEEALPAAAAH